MSSYVFNQVKEMVATGALSFAPNSGYNFKLALLQDDTIVKNPATYSSYTKWSDLNPLWEVPKDNVTNYTQKTLTNVGYIKVPDAGGVCDDNLPDYIVFAENISYNVSTISATTIIIVKSISPLDGINPDDLLLCAIDIRKLVGGVNVPVTSNNGVFTIQLQQSSGGFLKIK